MAQDIAITGTGGTLRAFRLRTWARVYALLTLLAVALWSAWTLERRFDGLEIAELDVGATPVTFYSLGNEEARPLAVVAHGFGGSRQMMDQISVTLARTGFAVAAFDFPGHGRHPGKLSPDITRIEGTTQQLVAATLDVVDAMQARADVAGPVSFVGHSMATDVVIRAAEATQNVASVTAISMYSEAVTPTSPERLLIVSGAQEGHLRAVGLEAIQQIDAEAGEGQTVIAGNVQRRTVAAPMVGHVGVLYSAATLDETSRWMAAAAGLTETRALDQTGWVAGALLVAIVLMAWPLAQYLPARAGMAPTKVARRDFLLSCALPVLPVVLVTYAMPGNLGATSGMVTLVAALATWGGVQIAWLVRAGYALPRPEGVATVAVLVWGLAIFGLALDHYGAAFLPTGPRIGVMALLMVGTLPLMLADAMLSAGAPLWRRVVSRVALIVVLGGAMALSPADMGLTFTVLPVMVLFFAVYGSFARWVSARRGPGTAYFAMGICLAWAIAASTPIFATAAL
ncbi:MAG: alpha/beta fold hydrolase [Pseudomonadota bacterium]